MNHVFGPVPSRRLGRSLGVDLVPHKTCTYDCIYCQVGRTTEKTLERREWVPLEAVLEELEPKLSTRPDYITLSGSGEPTLYSRTGELITRIKAMTEIPVAVLTNGSLLWRPEVRRSLMDADLVIPSLDAGDEAMFRRVNRPHEGITFDQMLSGLIDFRREFKGRYWLEVLLVAGYTDTDEEVGKIAACVERIRPERVQLNTVTRPPAEASAGPLTPGEMQRFAQRFSPPAEVIADFRVTHKLPDVPADHEEVLGMLARRPCSVEDVANGLGMHPTEAAKMLAALMDRGRVTQSRVGGRAYYHVR